MKNANREKIILEQLALKKKLDVDEVTQLLEISPATVRRIFSSMEQEGKVIRVHGGITQASGKSPEYSFEQLMCAQKQEKEQIGECAVREIRDGDIVYLDCGTTVLSLCLKLVPLLRSGALKNIQVFTNSLANLEVLSLVTQVNLIGGNYRPNRKDFSGYLAETAVNQLWFSKCFLGTDGINISSGFYTTDFDIANLNRLVASKSNRVYVLCDSQKFQKTSLIAYADIAAVNTVITDHAVDAQSVAALHEAGVQVIVAE